MNCVPGICSANRTVSDCFIHYIAVKFVNKWIYCSMSDILLLHNDFRSDGTLHQTNVQNFRWNVIDNNQNGLDRIICKVKSLLTL